MDSEMKSDLVETGFLPSTARCNKMLENAEKRRPPMAGIGKKRGTPNKVTKEVKDMILAALHNVGGQAYLEKQAIENPVAFLSLLGKIIPRDIKADVDLSKKVVIISEFPN